MKDARALDELANDLATNHMLLDDAFYTGRVHSIIQRCHASRARQGRKASAERRLIAHELAHEHVGALRAAAKAALPHQLGAFAGVLGVEGRAKQIVQLGRATAVAALGAAADDDLEPARRYHYREGTAELYSLPSAS
jgi:hypothetical protein